MNPMSETRNIIRLMEYENAELVVEKTIVRDGQNYEPGQRFEGAVIMSVVTRGSAEGDIMIHDRKYYDFELEEVKGMIVDGWNLVGAIRYIEPTRRHIPFCC